MKFVKKCLFIIAFVSPQRDIMASPQQPVSPCQSDAPRVVIFQNDIEDVLSDLCCSCQTDIPRAQTIHPIDSTNPTQKISNNCEQLGINPEEISIFINNKLLEHGTTTRVNIGDNAPLNISLKSSTWNLMNLLSRLNVIDKIQSSMAEKIKSFTTGILNNTYCFFTDDSAEQIYERNKATYLRAYLKAYKNTFGLFGGECTINIVIDAQKIQEVIEDIANPTVNFYDVLDVVLTRLNEPEHVTFSGSYYHPVITIV